MAAEPLKKVGHGSVNVSCFLADESVRKVMATEPLKKEVMAL